MAQIVGGRAGICMYAAVVVGSRIVAYPRLLRV